MRPKTNSIDDLEHVVREAWDGDCYRFHEIAETLTPKVAIDIGASCGPATIKILETWPGCFVHAYEPDPVRFALLQENTASLGGRVQLYMNGVCGSNREHVGSGCVPHLPCPQRRDAAEVFAYMTAFGSTEIPAASLPEADLMKIDCEGFEWGIIEDLAGLDRLPTVIVGEWHFSNCRDAITEILSKTHTTTIHDPDSPWAQFLAVRK